ALVAARAPAQTTDRVGGGDQEAGDDVTGEIHVDELVPEVAVAKERLPRMHVDGFAVTQMEAGRMIHPAIDRDHRQRPGDAGNRDRDAASEMGSRGEPATAVGVDPDEDRFHEEGEAFNRKSETEDAPEAGGEARPQQAHLETEDRARYDPGREQGRH